MSTITEPEKNTLSPDDLPTILEQHRAWLNSDGADGKRANLKDADLSDADLSGTNLERAQMVGANLSGADLCYALLDQADLTRANLTDAELCHASLMGTDLTWANLTAADLSHANLTGAILADADMARADLTSADLSEADMDGADMSGTELSNTTMLGTHLTGTRFDDVGDSGFDAAFDADQVLEDTDPSPISELPDADELDPDETESVTPTAAVINPPPKATPIAVPVVPTVAPAATPAIQPSTARPKPVAPSAVESGSPSQLTSTLRSRLAAHQKWLKSNGQSGQRASLVALSPITAEALAGVDLTHAILPPETPLRQLINASASLSRDVRQSMAVMLLLCLYSLTTLVAALANPMGLASLPLFNIPIPSMWLHMAMPPIVLIGHLWLSLRLIRLNRSVARLPQRLPDGTPPWPATTPSSAGRLLAMCMAPATLMLHWGALMAHTTPAISVSHALLTATAAGLSAISTPRRAGTARDGTRTDSL